MKTAFLFAGQGSQYAGMGKDLYEAGAVSKELYHNEALPFDLAEVCFTDAQNLLADTTYAQPALLTTSLAIASVLKAWIKPDYVCGLSLGEYSALAFAGVLSYQDAQMLVFRRGKLMAEALPANTTGMMAVLQLDASTIAEICAQVTGVCEIANYNCPGQIVISGELEALAQAKELCLARGARRVLPLAVSGAFHSSLLTTASKQLQAVLDDYVLHTPEVPVVFNVSGQVETTGIKELLEKQICSPVLFEQSIRYLLDQGVTRFIEIGPGTALSGFVKKIAPDAIIYKADTMESMQKLKEAVYGNI